MDTVAGISRHSNLERFSKEELIRFIEDYSKNWLAMDGVWFQSVEQALSLKFYANLNEATFERGEGRLVYTMKNCRVQYARERKGMPHSRPIAPVLCGISGLSRVIEKSMRTVYHIVPPAAWK